MNQNKAFTERLIIVNNNLIGPKRRTNNPEGYHPMVRNFWRSRDKFRAVLGNYFTVYSGLAGPSLYNYSSAQDAGGGSAVDIGSTGIGPLADQLDNIVLSIANSPDIETDQSPTLLIRYNTENWKQYVDPTSNAWGFLDDHLNGANYIYGFYERKTTTYAGLMNEISEIPAAGTEPGIPILDCTSYFFKPSPNKNIRLAANQFWDALPVYNNYADTFPPYEVAIGPSAIADYFLPNSYILQAELNNVGDRVLAPSHAVALTLNGQSGWLNDVWLSWASNVTEENDVDPYYQHFANGAERVTNMIGDGIVGNFNLVRDAMSLDNKNFIVLHSDINLLNEGYLALEKIPFYNKLVIGHDDFSITGKGSPEGVHYNPALAGTTAILQTLANNPDTADFINILQTAAAEVLTLGTYAPPATPVPFRRTIRRLTDPTDLSKFRYLTSEKNYQILFDLDTEIEAYIDDGEDSLLGRSADAINSFETKAAIEQADISLDPTPGYRFLKDFSIVDYASSTEGLSETEAATAHAYPEFQVDPQAIAAADGELDGMIAAVTKTYTEILANTPCHTETLMYIVTKYNFDKTEPQQVWYLSARFDDEEMPLTYIDSQIKFANNYRYNISKVVLIIGNEYQYGYSATELDYTEYAPDFAGDPDPDPPPVSRDWQTRTTVVTEAPAWQSGDPVPEWPPGRTEDHTTNLTPGATHTLEDNLRRLDDDYRPTSDTAYPFDNYGVGNETTAPVEGEAPGTGTPATQADYHTTVQVINTAAPKLVVVPYLYGITAIVTDKPPVPPEISFYPFEGVNNKINILLNSNTGEIRTTPVAILPRDSTTIQEQYHSQTGQLVPYEIISNLGLKMDFRSDDPVGLYELFKLDKAPLAYTEFKVNLLDFTNSFVDPGPGTPGAYIDSITPNRKYYYCARSIDVHGNSSNPTYIYEIEMVDNNGQMYLKQKLYMFPSPQQTFVKSGRRLLLIDATPPQATLSTAALDAGVGTPDVEGQPLDNILGAAAIEDSVWGKEFKLRLTSKKTGRKMDLNINFKNTGIVNESE
jgi:hypothetical protein